MLWDRKSIHTIHCFGDSLTAGYGAVPGAGWVEVVAKRHPEINWTNHASLGALTEDILDALEGTVALTSGQEGFFFQRDPEEPREQPRRRYSERDQV